MAMSGKILQAFVGTSLTSEPRTRDRLSGESREEGFSSIHFKSPRKRCRNQGAFSIGNRSNLRLATWFLCLLIACTLLSACDLTPSKPEAIFILYRDRMKSDRVEEARKLLTQESRDLATKAGAQYKLKQYPENLALLNVLDPMSIPLVMKEQDDAALLQLRTLKGGLRLVRLVRNDAKSPWQVDISAELKSFADFLEVRAALDMMREQAGEYAASWKAFDNQLRRMQVVEPPPAPPRSESPAPKPTDKPRRKPRTR